MLNGQHAECCNSKWFKHDGACKKNDLQLWQSLGLARSASRSLRNLIRSTRPDHRGPIHTRISNHTHMEDSFCSLLLGWCWHPRSWITVIHLTRKMTCDQMLRRLRLPREMWTMESFISGIVFLGLNQVRLVWLVDGGGQIGWLM